eukprot:c9661_g1_i1.p1 GENE.c9661_g1_i1~~c9661_g1_i1.p1  ORF type:complete len:210 (+),score=53.54 c9661_g1_i1:178-807(+)
MSADSNMTALDYWKHQVRMVVFSLIEMHSLVNEFDVALELMRQLTYDEPTSPHLWQQSGLLALQMGSLALAQRLLSTAERLFTEQNTAEISVEAHMTKGIMKILLAQYSEALDEFELVTEYSQYHIGAHNNKAICHLHLGKLMEAIEVLETVLITNPNSMGVQSLVQNLCALYDLQNNNVQGKKQVLLEVAKTVAPDTFDTSVLRLPVK